MSSQSVAPLVRVRGLSKFFPVRAGLLGRQTGAVHAVDELNFDIRAGETLGLVGESGSGKTTVSRMLIRLLSPSSGIIQFDGKDIHGQHGEGVRKLRREMQIVFQDPFGSLDPRMTAQRIIAEPLVIDGAMNGAQRRGKIKELMDLVGLPSAFATRYPHQFSGGQRQRIGIARALALGPRFLVCDEAVSALDLSVQAQIVNLLADLQKELGLTTLFVSHDLQVVKHVSTRVAVMYLGRIVEIAPTASLFDAATHPYTEMLLESAPSLRRKRSQKRSLTSTGELPSPLAPPSGCHFHPRCSLASDICKKERPTFTELGKDHLVACHHSGSE